MLQECIFGAVIHCFSLNSTIEHLDHQCEKRYEQSEERERKTKECKEMRRLRAYQKLGEQGAIKCLK